eukprot:TRINITY_DN10027_c0_g1_i1.p1 TRINITY_DN10027_c0_g1~~TRINITY_DN10027_c0_g1_i1.p1  ORF type:complete len:481 (+),score=56.39 TRINITY_DN10027_c0_g1_i1:95-1537(+)
MHEPLISQSCMYEEKSKRHTFGWTLFQMVYELGECVIAGVLFTLILQHKIKDKDDSAALVTSSTTLAYIIGTFLVLIAGFFVDCLNLSKIICLVFSLICGICGLIWGICLKFDNISVQIHCLFFIITTSFYKVPFILNNSWLRAFPSSKRNTLSHSAFGCSYFLLFISLVVARLITSSLFDILPEFLKQNLLFLRSWQLEDIFLYLTIVNFVFNIFYVICMLNFKPPTSNRQIQTSSFIFPSFHNFFHLILKLLFRKRLKIVRLMLFGHSLYVSALIVFFKLLTAYYLHCWDFSEEVKQQNALFVTSIYTLIQSISAILGFVIMKFFSKKNAYNFKANAIALMVQDVLLILLFVSLYFTTMNDSATSLKCANLVCWCIGGVSAISMSISRSFLTSIVPKKNISFYMAISASLAIVFQALLSLLCSWLQKAFHHMDYFPFLLAFWCIFSLFFMIRIINTKVIKYSHPNSMRFSSDGSEKSV